MAALEPGKWVSTIPVEGALRVPLNPELSDKVRARLARGDRWLQLDLARLSHIDAAGVGQLVGAFNRARAVGGVLRIAHASRRVARLLRLCGLLTILSAGDEGAHAA